jgi:hypothetical protein
VSTPLNSTGLLNWEVFLMVVPDPFGVDLRPLILSIVVLAMIFSLSRCYLIIPGEIQE